MRLEVDSGNTLTIDASNVASVTAIVKTGGGEAKLPDSQVWCMLRYDDLHTQMSVRLVPCITRVHGVCPPWALVLTFGEKEILYR